MKHGIGKKFMGKRTKIRIYNATQLCLNSYPGNPGRPKKVAENEEFFKFEDSRDTMTMGTVYDGSDIYLCFQGSQEKSDWVRNIDKELLDLDDDIKCHEGFFEHFHKFREEISEHIDEMLRFDFDRIIICGHSLGGALAVLCCYELMFKKYFEYHDLVTCITLGSPRVGNVHFRNFFDSVFPCYRLVYGSDVVCRIPKFAFWSWYYHVGKTIQLGKSRWLASTSDHDCQNYRDAFEPCLKIDLPID